jgi:hypothetical protein
MEPVTTMGIPATESGSMGTPVGLVTLVRLLRSCSSVRRFMKQNEGATPAEIALIETALAPVRGRADTLEEGESGEPSTQ